MTIRKWRILTTAMSVLGVVFLVIFNFTGRNWMTPIPHIGLLLVILAIGLNVHYVRCPHCKQHLNNYEPYKIEKCPHCGRPLEKK